MRTAQPDAFWTHNATSIDADASERLRRLGWGKPRVPQPQGQGWWTVQPQNTVAVRADWGQWDASQLPRGLDLKQNKPTASFGGTTPTHKADSSRPSLNPNPNLWLTANTNTNTNKNTNTNTNKNTNMNSTAQPLASLDSGRNRPAVQPRWIDQQPQQPTLTQTAQHEDSDMLEE